MVGCSEPVDDEQQIRDLVAQMVKGVETKELSQTLAPVHEDFLGNKHMRRANLRGVILVHNRRHKNLHVFVNDLNVTLDGDMAQVTCNVALAGRDKILPERGRILKVESRWQKLDGEWFVMEANWKDPLYSP